MEHRHLRGVHYLEFTCEIIMKGQMTLDGFSFVKTKHRYEIHIYSIVFLCMHVVPWVLKHNTELFNYQAKQSVPVSYKRLNSLALLHAYNSTTYIPSTIKIRTKFLKKHM